eukprot:1160093-Pelagomonas_calceolata.AAC.6
MPDPYAVQKRKGEQGTHREELKEQQQQQQQGQRENEEKQEGAQGGVPGAARAKQSMHKDGSAGGATGTKTMNLIAGFAIANYPCESHWRARHYLCSLQGFLPAKHT